MSRLKNLVVRPGPAIVAILTAMLLSGCATIKYSYDVQTKFPDLKTYRWGVSSGADPLVETNVQFFADQYLESKGLSLNPDQADLLVWMNYHSEYGKTYQLQTLSLSIARADDRQLIWRGTASGSIRTDGDSKDLEGVVKGILASFPPQ